MKRSCIERRVLKEAKYFVNNNSTVRETAKHFGVSKSTVHRDITKRLKKLMPTSKLNDRIRFILDFNLSERHIRGGKATKKKYSDAK